MSALIIAFVGYTVVFGMLWHNRSAREGNHDNTHAMHQPGPGRQPDSNKRA